MNYKKMRIHLNSQIEEYKKLLEEEQLQYEKSEYQLGVYDGETLIGGISLDGNTIKQLVVKKEFKGQGVSNALISETIKYAFSLQIYHIFIYTKPENEEQLNSLGFYTIYKSNKILFLENQKNGIREYCNTLNLKKVEGSKIGSIVMNANPITKGHNHLVKEATQECDHVHLFLVKEDASSFPYEDRLELVKKVTEKYNNITIHKGSCYIISKATFPKYFIKSEGEVLDAYATLDVNIFGKYISEALDINFRYIGTEPYSKTTNVYNEILKKDLVNYNITVEEKDRFKIGNEIVSASKVRNLISIGQLEDSYIYLPEETIDFLKSDNGKKIIDEIKNTCSRH